MDTCMASSLNSMQLMSLWSSLQVSMPASATGASGISSMPDGRSSSPVARTHNEPEAEPLVPALVEDASHSTTAAAPGPHSVAPEETAPTVLQVHPNLGIQAIFKALNTQRPQVHMLNCTLSSTGWGHTALSSVY